MSDLARKIYPATIEDLLAMPEEDRYELVNGQLAPKEAATGKHGAAQSRTSGHLLPYDRRQGPPDQPGGWRFATEVLIRIAPGQIRRPDVAGWRRETLPAWPEDAPITVVPDWICEILSSNRSTDLVMKMSLYHEAKIRHYWILDPDARTLTIYRYTPEGYLHVLAAAEDQTVRAEPFGLIAVPVRSFFEEE